MQKGEFVTLQSIALNCSSEAELLRCQSDGAREQAAQRAVESPLLEIIMIHLEAFLCDLLWETTLARGLDLVISRGSFQPLRFCDSVKVELKVRKNSIQ